MVLVAPQQQVELDAALLRIVEDLIRRAVRSIILG
jgi:hypothetical protein